MTCLWRVPDDHPAFAGHFPGRPIVPGVVILDQAILFAARQLSAPRGWTVDNAKFLSPVSPGEVLSFDFSPRARGGLQFAVRAGERKVASGVLTPSLP